MIIDETYDNPGDFFAHLANDRAVALEARANAVLAAHEQAATDYTRDVETPEWSPFVEMPNGTGVRDLPDGPRIFELTDGALLLAYSENQFGLMDAQGETHTLSPVGKYLDLPDGRRFELKSTGPSTDHAPARVQGLPVETAVVDLGHGRFRASLTDFDLVIDHGSQTVTLANHNGTFAVLGKQTFGIGEQVTTSPIGDGRRSFTTESGHRGIIDPTGTINISTNNGLDLVVSFEAGDSQGDQPVTSPGPFRCNGFPV